MRIVRASHEGRIVFGVVFVSGLDAIEIRRVAHRTSLARHSARASSTSIVSKRTSRPRGIAWNAPRSIRDTTAITG